MIDRARLRPILGEAERTGLYPANAQLLNGKTQGDFEFELGAFRELVDSIEQEQFSFLTLVPDIDGPQSHVHGYELFVRAVFSAGAVTGAANRESLEPVSMSARITEWSGTVEVAGDLVVGGGEATLIVEGSLHVEGNLVLRDGAQLVVLANTTVAGDWNSATWAMAAMCGDVSVGGAAVMGGETYVGGGLRAPVIYVPLEDCIGHLKVLSGAAARVFVEDPREGFAYSEIHGASSVQLAIADYDVVLGRLPRQTPITVDRRWEASTEAPASVSCLVPELAGVSPATRALADELVRRIRSREPILIGSPSDGWLYSE